MKGRLMKFTMLTLTVMILTILTLGCSKKEEPVPPAPAPASTDAPAFDPASEAKFTASAGQLGQKAAPLEDLTYVKGKPVTFQKDKVYVVEFWATWCAPCLKSIPHLTDVQKRFKDKDVTIIGISNEPVDKVTSFVEKMGDEMDYTVAVETDNKIGNAYMRAFGQSGIPTAFIVDGNGQVAWVGHPMGELETVLEAITAGEFDIETYVKEKAEREALQRRLHGYFQDYFTAIQNGAPIEESRPIAEQIIEIGNPDALNALAWQILMGADEPQRDNPTALKAAEKANTQTNGENPMVLDTYALALFENDQVAEAVKVQEKAIALTSGNEQMQAELTKRLNMFKQALETSRE